MQYSPKLKNAISEINEILDKYDVAGSIVLYDVGNSEYLLKINPSYSCASFDGDNLRVKARLKEDFNGDIKSFQKKKSDTSNMLSLLAESTGFLSLNLLKISKIVDEKMGAEHFGNSSTSHTTQNN